MGGSGSGRHWSTVRGTTSECPSLDVRRLQRGRLLLPGQSFPYEWTRSGKKVASVQVTTYEDRIELAYDHVGAGAGRQGERYCYSVLLEWLPCNYGGRSAWFRCPAIGCGRRVAILYGKGPFACRHCHRLAYPSQRQLAYWRAVSRARAIRQRLGGTANLCEPFPAKPKGMHWQTYGSLFREHETAKAAVYAGWFAALTNRAENQVGHTTPGP
jgi:hypothetical protein